MTNRHPQELWDASYEALAFDTVPPGDALRGWMERHLRGRAPGSALEIGCFPGRYLAFLGERGYELSGIDLTPRTEPEMAAWLRGRGFKTGRFLRADFLATEPFAQFDLVYSNGFLEHFSDWDAVLRRHAAWVKPGGLLLVSAPNFRGAVQQALHRLLDPENLAVHHLPAMDPLRWRRELSQEGFEVLEAGWLGGFDFWVGAQRRSLLERVALRAVRAAIPLARRLAPEGAEAFAPWCVLAAQRPAEGSPPAAG